MKILFIRFSSIGDIILSTSTVKSLFRELPNSKIDFLTLENYGPLLEGLSYINKLHLLDKNAGLLQLISVGKYFNNYNYDIVIDMHNSIRSKIIRKRIHSKDIYVLSKPRWRRFQLFSFHYQIEL